MAVSGCQCFEFDRIAQHGSGAVSLDEVDGVGRHVGGAQSIVMTSRCANTFGAVSPLDRPS